ncbi:VRR-NUC domain-containing protein [Photobacterium ganghwense]|uniref:VRR-NUC domain-containing protein n=1 Tax=Photobacterium ganghwense TaxID=320778 RepID=UPI001C2DC4A9|nr:VRR-NUC domain-containing protein [Photobacterium ganghwense]MBV1841507.1 VRR-NUC domain-containing protein [Photobacterium ganghwense]
MKQPALNMTSQPILKADYYRDNFLVLIRHVRQQYSDLLTETEHHWLDTFDALSLDGQLLYIRLLSRKGPLFRQQKLHYQEISSIPAACDELVMAGFIIRQPEHWSAEQLGALFTKPELLELFPALSPVKQAKKNDLLTALHAFHPDISDFGEPILEVCHTEFLSVLLLCFFGNSHQDLSEFVLADLGLYRYESYRIDRFQRLFTQREQIDQWLALSQLADEYQDAAQRKDSEQILALSTQLPARFDWPPLERKRQRLINQLARDIERLGVTNPDHLPLALSLFQQSELPPSRERQVRILDRLQEIEQALPLALAMAEDPVNEQEGEVADTLLRQLRRKQGQRTTPRRKPVFDEVQLTLPQQAQRVELVVAEHYARQGWTACYTENALICGLFGLAFWDIIFAPMPGAFLNPFQRSPRDMYQPEFAEQRETLIEARLHHIANGQWQQWLAVYREKEGLTNDWVNWTLLSREVVERSVAAFPPDALAQLFQRILFDPKSNRSGFPDLILFKEDRYCWVEVKGPGDKLQSNQIRWLTMFQTLKIPAQVAYVSWADATD